jgi:hypothetical protein
MKSANATDGNGRSRGRKLVGMLALALCPMMAWMALGQTLQKEYIYLNGKLIAVENAAAADTTPPTISSVASSSVTGTGAAITWTTNENSDSQVEYGTTTAYGSSTALNASMLTSHSWLLSIMLCLIDSLGSLESGLKHSIKLRKDGGDAASYSFPAAFFE